MQSETPSEQGPSAHQEPNAILSVPTQPLLQPDHYHGSGLESSESTQTVAGSGPPTSLRPTERSPLKRGSSRDSDMHRSSTPPEGSSSGAIKYTRTGRVSKATKGQRVHQCDECGKTYTRAEHLRRHQQNHNPGAFPCDIPGCTRSFYREDLLNRHKARHNDPLNPPSRRGSVGSQHSDQGVERRQQASTPAATSRSRTHTTSVEYATQDFPLNAPTSVGQQTEASRYDGSRVFRAPQPLHDFFDSLTLAPRKGYLNINELPVASQAISINTSGAYPEYPFGQPWNPSSPRSTAGYDSPTNDITYGSSLPYFGQPRSSGIETRSSAAFYSGYSQPHGTRSPVSAGSSTAYMNQWTTGAQSPAFNHFSSSSSSDGTYVNGTGVYNIFGDQHMVPLVLNGVTRMMSAEDRDAMERTELPIPSTLPQPSFDCGVDIGSTITNEQRYLCAYWSFIHPLFPIVHKPSFSLQSSSPLLRASMLALGAHILQNPTDMGHARIVHERCSKVIKKRNINGWHTYRVCDMQALVLHEIYAIFKSRRPPLHFSKNFEDIYRMLAEDPQALGQDSMSPPNDSPIQMNAPSSEYGDDTVCGMMNSHEAKCKQRLLLACYILDQQHATLFGRPQVTGLNVLGASLPFVRSQEYWDALPEQQAGIRFRRRSSGAPVYNQVYEAMAAVPGMTEISDDPFDAFQSFLMMACFNESSSDLQSVGCQHPGSPDISPILVAMEQSARMGLAYHTLMLCKHTQIRDLLAVAGESWCMAEKLGSQSDYLAAQLEALNWAKGWTSPETGFVGELGQTPVERALYHARQILDLHRQHPKTGILFQEWSIYLAAVVIWARAYVMSSSPHQKPRRLAPTAAESIPASQTLEQSVTDFLNAAPATTLSMSEVRNILLWTKAKIEMVDMPHNCGLTNGALDVLGKLASRGAEQGWFGDL